jgi:putative ABC transport system permease protein
MSPLGLAWRSLTRQPARAVLGIIGVAAVGALLFDMLMLSRGLVLSFDELLDSVGFDVRVTATEALPGMGPRLEDVRATVEALRDLDAVDSVAALRFEQASVELPGDEPREIGLIGADTDTRDTWRIVSGRGLDAEDDGDAPPILVNRLLASELRLSSGDLLPLWGRCGRAAALPSIVLRVAGVADFAFDATTSLTAALRLRDLSLVCGEEADDSADLLLVASAPRAGADAAVAAIAGARPDLNPFSNEQFLRRFERTDFSYFRQISFVLATMTLFFAFLLIAALLTVSVNQRLAEVAALRALGFPRRRIVADLLCESALLVGSGGLLSIPVGGSIALWLDSILRGMPGLPARLHFFVFEPRALAFHVMLLAVTGLLAVLYPVYLAARLPIAATLRREVVS